MLLEGEFSFDDLLGMFMPWIEDLINGFLGSIPFNSIFAVIGVILSVIVGMLLFNSLILWLVLKYIMKTEAKFGSCIITQLYITLATIGFSLIPIVGSIFAIFFSFNIIANRHGVTYWNGALVWLISNLIPIAIALIITFASLGLLVF
jgi:hypothetical protein